ncbi:cell division protein ZapA [Alkalihalobacillus alcalophilus ATCC 27647 = CGMCC 1.3604]|uniref:Cell division protein ZapA n=1 Tax=Alkalihalobacillus alcalophilus ATCC 27647 = CGMCC 1.3604 TaxID=1218173 RepID=A0A4S4JZQ3_ALKAL|nr:cell division protein ZapA [Alkalihalobacillus alcalophilus]MED1563563.1 cell division protein ZapA [Alkalihalobacillus alcalophilus]THG90795.1 cell division protein ZapA [Alkalihalobacillus alcalophilus ATCC 27647 = CGMCC 1.3604]
MADDKQKQRTTVSIYGQAYTVVGKEPPSHIKEVAQSVDQKMREIKKRNPYLDTTRLAVLTAVNVVDEYMKIIEERDALLKKIADAKGVTGEDKDA